MVIVNGNTFNPEGRQKLDELKKDYNEFLNTLKCPNNCKKDMLINLEYHERKKRVIACVSGACCGEFEREIKLYIKPYLK